MKMKNLHKQEEKYHHQAERAMKKDEKIHEKLEKTHRKEEKHGKKKHHSKASSTKKSHAKKAGKKTKVEKVLHEFKEGILHSGSKKGPMVKSRKQAIAIGLSEARKAGEKIKPMRKKK